VDDANERSEASNWTDNSGYTHVELYPDGNYKSFVPEIDTEWVLDGVYVKLKATCVVKFFPNGNIERCVLGSETVLKVSEVRVLLSEGTNLEFHANGNVRSLTLAVQSRIPWRSKKWRYRGIVYDPRTKMEFADDGSVVSSEKA